MTFYDHGVIFYWNLARLVGIKVLSTLICLTWALSRMSPRSRLSVRLIPFEYTTVKSGISSPGSMTLRGDIVQFCIRQSPAPR